MLRSYISGYLFNTKIAQNIYKNEMKEFQDCETYIYFPFWIVGWLGLKYGGIYTYNSKPLIFKMPNDANGYVEDTSKAKKLFSFESELRILYDKIRLSKNDDLIIQCNLDANNIYYIKNVTLKYDKSIQWDKAFTKIKEIIKQNRKHPKISIIYFYYFSILMKTKNIIKKIIRYKSKYKI